MRDGGTRLVGRRAMRFERAEFLTRSLSQRKASNERNGRLDREKWIDSWSGITGTS